MTHDAAGNASADGTGTFGYDGAGRLTSASKGGNSASYAHNALGQRVRKTINGTSTIFSYDESGHLLGEYQASGALIREYVWLGDIPVAVITGGPGTPPYVFWYVHADHLNTPRSVENPTTGELVWRWDSAPFGETAPDEDPDGDFNLFSLPLRFPGQYADQETGLNYNYFRDYEPAIGRYVQSDPIGLDGGMSTFAYADANPLDQIDPLGLEPSGPRNPRRGVSLSCKWTDTCKQIEAKMSYILRIISSHTGWDNRMPRPRGGNRHAEEIAGWWRAYGNCQRIHNAKCRQACAEPQPAISRETAVAIGTGAVVLGVAGCIAFAEVCVPALLLGGGTIAATQ